MNRTDMTKMRLIYMRVQRKRESWIGQFSKCILWFHLTPSCSHFSFSTSINHKHRIAVCNLRSVLKEQIHLPADASTCRCVKVTKTLKHQQTRRARSLIFWAFQRLRVYLGGPKQGVELSWLPGWQSRELLIPWSSPTASVQSEAETVLVCWCLTTEATELTHPDHLPAACLVFFFPPTKLLALLQPAASWTCIVWHLASIMSREQHHCRSDMFTLERQTWTTFDQLSFTCGWKMVCVFQDENKSRLTRLELMWCCVSAKHCFEMEINVLT